MIVWCFGRIQGKHPIFIPKESVLEEKLIEEAHIFIHHGGGGGEVTLKVTKIRSENWIQSYGYKRFHINYYPEPLTRLSPVERTTQNLPFEIICIDYAGPLICKTRGGKETKVYIILFTCSLTRAIHLELLPNHSTY